MIDGRFFWLFNICELYYRGKKNVCVNVVCFLQLEYDRCSDYI